MYLNLFKVILSIAMAMLSVTGASADLLYGLTSSNQLIMFNSNNPGSVMTIGTITQAGIVDIDVHGANSVLYGMTGNGTMVRIDTNTAGASNAVSPSMSLDGTVTDMDFNPAVDRVRVFTDGTTNKNYRIQPDFASPPQMITQPGGVIADGLFSNPAYMPVGSAYTNPVDNAPSSTLYSIGADGNLYIHSVGPQFGTVTAIGATGLGALGSNVGFDIAQSGMAYMTSGNSLYSVNLGTGQATLLGTVGGSGLVSIAAAVPEPTAFAMFAILGLGAIARRRRV